MHRVALTMVVALSIASVADEAPAQHYGTPFDWAHVAGTWDYRAQSNCGRDMGVGAVTFTWNPSVGGYDELGHIRWPSSGRTIRWWGVVRFDVQSMRLVGRMRNTLGDEVDAIWELEGEGPDRLVVRWEQTNGCRGVGIATRRVP